MEKFVIYIPELKKQFKRGDGFQEQLHYEFNNQECSTIYVAEENKLYLSSVTLGSMEFQLVSLDFERNKITFKKKKNSSADVQAGVYEIFSSMQLDFLPTSMSFVMQRPIEVENSLDLYKMVSFFELIASFSLHFEYSD